MLLLDDQGGKPEGINLVIGRRPYAAFGNSTGDQQMLEWTQAGEGARVMMLVHHDDAKREYAYGAESLIGTFSDCTSRRSERARLERDQHEERLEADLSVRPLSQGAHGDVGSRRHLTAPIQFPLRRLVAAPTAPGSNGRFCRSCGSVPALRFA